MVRDAALYYTRFFLRSKQKGAGFAPGNAGCRFFYENPLYITPDYVIMKDVVRDVCLAYPETGTA